VIMNGSGIEARCFQGLVDRGVMTVEAARGLIGVSETEELAMRKFLDPVVISRILSDRREILAQFNRAIEEIERSRNTERRHLSRNVRISRVQLSKVGAASRSL